jgi:hypothetical protein
MLVRNDNDLVYNVEEHKYQKLFLLLTNPIDNEKMPLTAVKIIDNFIGKHIPKILDFFIFSSLKKVLQRTDWLRAADENIEMNSINKLSKLFGQKSPLCEGGKSQISTALGKIDLTYLINNENFVTACEAKENFDSRKTKIKDENYKTLYD